MQECKLVKVLIHIGVILSIDQCLNTRKEEDDMSHVSYASAVGSLMYAMVCTKLDIAHALGFLSRYMSKPKKDPWETLKRVFRYFRGTTTYRL